MAATISPTASNIGVCTFTLQSFSNQDSPNGLVTINNGVNTTEIIGPNQFGQLNKINVSIYFALIIFPNCTIFPQEPQSQFLPSTVLTTGSSFDLVSTDNLTEFIATGVSVATSIQGYVAFSSFNCRGPLESLGKFVNATTNKTILDHVLQTYGLSYSRNRINSANFFGDVNTADDQCDTWSFFVDSTNYGNNEAYVIQNGYGPIAVNFTFITSDACANISLHSCSDICINVLRSYRCDCPTGFHLLNDNNTCAETDECLTFNGNCSQICNNTVGSYNCTCYDGYNQMDFYDCQDIDECNLNNGNCSDYCNNTSGSYFCSCPVGYLLSGSYNCEDINECQLSNGNCSDICTNTNGSYSCSCNPGYVLLNDMQTCEDIDECSIMNGNCSDFCNNTAGGYNCSCPSGYILGVDGFNCEDINECSLTNGNCDQICQNTNGSYVCDCNTGYMLQSDKHSCQDINECSFSNCTQICNNTGGGYNCMCYTGFVLADDNHTCTDINECLVNNGNCSDSCNNTEGSFTCTCQDGFQLQNDSATCQDINECAVSNGKCSHFCNNTEGSYQCSCPGGYFMEADNKTCSELLCQTQNPCLNGATCKESPNGAQCVCNTENTGRYCETLLFCSSNPCGPNGACDEANQTCNCDAGYTGSRCETALFCLLNNTCMNGASCSEGSNKAVCQCLQGYTGESCESELQCVTSNTCQNGATCLQQSNGTRCACIVGFTGQNCETELYCITNNNCFNNAQCEESANGSICSCLANYTGSNCETELYCTPVNPCQNNGQCSEGLGQAMCQCSNNFTGQNCETELNCVSMPCQNGGTCSETTQGHTCSCPSGTQGQNCEKILFCEIDNQCENNSTCKEGALSAICECKTGFLGNRCEVEQICITRNPCQNGGTCDEFANSVNCTCPIDSTGLFCETRLYCEPSNPCLSGGICVEGSGSATCIYCSPTNPCINNGTCTEGGNRPICSCPTGIIGNTCQMDNDECNLGIHKCPQDDMCVNTFGSYRCTCQAGYALQADGTTCKDIDECQTSKGGCSDICSNNPGSFQCSCATGYSLAGDKVNCVDTDECLKSNCSQICTNTVGSYNCSCYNGYVLSANKHNCQDVNECLDETLNICSQKCINEIPGFKCACNTGFALTSDGKTCGAALPVQSITPTYGPIDGGTQVTITADFSFVNNITAVFLYPANTQDEQIQKSDNNSLACYIVNWNASLLVFSTPKVIDSFTAQRMSILIEYITSSQDIITGNFSLFFTYKPNPVITDIYPKQAFISGGISITAIGMHLDSVANPVMIINAEQRQPNTAGGYVLLKTFKFQSQNTSVFNSTSIVGLTPNLTSLSKLFSRRKRQTPNTGQSINGATLQIFIGFELDGSERYQNLSVALNPDDGKLYVYGDPQVELFGNTVYHFDPQKDNHIDIKGKRFLLGATIVDFRAAIGNQSCAILAVTDNAVSCKPPSDEPASLPGSIAIPGKPLIKLWIGDLGYNVGYIDYTIDKSAILYSAIGVGTFMFILILLTVSCVIFVKYHSYQDKRKNRLSYLEPVRNNHESFKPGYLESRSYQHARQKPPGTFDGLFQYDNEIYRSYRA